MTPQEIKDGMTQDVWYIRPYENDLTIVGGDSIFLANCNASGLIGLKNKIANANAITTAVNATFNKGYNPEAMEECVKMLELISENYFSEISPFTIKSIEEIITKSKL